jgi:hypothetical protein
MMTLLSPTRPAAPDAQTGGHVVSYRIVDLLPHPALTRLSLGPSARELSDAIIRREQGHWDPVTISRERYILAGQAQWMLGQQRNESHLDCLQLDLSESEALLWLIERHKRSSGLNDFSRILLALELESLFRERAASNRSRGGREKGSSNLTEADHVDVRSEIAKAAGVSVGNVSKAKKLISASCSELLEALREGEVSIHRASQWIECGRKPEDSLRLHRSRRGIRRDVRQLIAQHRSSPTPPREHLDLERIAKAIVGMTPDKRKRIAIGKFPHPGLALVVSSDLLTVLESQGEFDAI